jgi:NAD(P)-dependent dehydrogenase (short-subunit alcohol dehydrogenase family)
MQLEGKTALVTGGSSGIGLATAKRFAAAGATVIVTGRAGERLTRAAEELGKRAETIPADMTEPADIVRLMTQVRERHGQLDILVVNAGVSNAPAVGELNPAAYAALMDVNCRGATFTFVHALPLLSDGAAVAFVGSVAGRKGQPGDALYAGSKGFIRAFARNLGTDPAILARGIRVNVVSPGPIDTPLTAEAVANPEADAYVTQQLVPMKRWGRPEDVANAILFLCSEASSFTTGAEVTVDGGMAHV